MKKLTQCYLFTKRRSFKFLYKLYKVPLPRTVLTTFGPLHLPGTSLTLSSAWACPGGRPRHPGGAGLLDSLPPLPGPLPVPHTPALLPLISLLSLVQINKLPELSSLHPLRTPALGKPPASCWEDWVIKSIWSPEG